MLDLALKSLHLCALITSMIVVPQVVETEDSFTRTLSILGVIFSFIDEVGYVLRIIFKNIDEFSFRYLMFCLEIFFLIKVLPTYFAETSQIEETFIKIISDMMCEDC